MCILSTFGSSLHSEYIDHGEGEGLYAIYYGKYQFSSGIAASQNVEKEEKKGKEEKLLDKTLAPEKTNVWPV